MSMLQNSTKLNRPQAQIEAATLFCSSIISFVEAGWPEMKADGFDTLNLEMDPETTGLCDVDVLDALACLGLRFELAGTEGYEENHTGYFQLVYPDSALHRSVRSRARKVVAHLLDDGVFGGSKARVAFIVATEFGCGPHDLIFVEDKDAVAGAAYQMMFETNDGANGAAVGGLGASDLNDRGRRAAALPAAGHPR